MRTLSSRRRRKSAPSSAVDLQQGPGTARVPLRVATCCPPGSDATRLRHRTMTGGTETTIRVAIVEDRREIREGLATIINGTPGFRCTGSYRSMEDALERISGDVPDVVLSDIGLPGMNGIDGIRILCGCFGCSSKGITTERPRQNSVSRSTRSAFTFAASMRKLQVRMSRPPRAPALVPKRTCVRGQVPGRVSVTAVLLFPSMHVSLSEWRWTLSAVRRFPGRCRLGLGTRTWLARQANAGHRQRRHHATVGPTMM